MYKGGNNYAAYLIADDNHDITDILSTYSKMEGFEPVVAYDGEEATDYLRSIIRGSAARCHDAKRRRIRGLRKIRSKSDVPVILITARGEDFDKIMGLDRGADDYIVKPFSPREVGGQSKGGASKDGKRSKSNAQKMLSLSVI